MKVDTQIKSEILYFSFAVIDDYGDLPRIGGGQSSPINPHSGMSGGGFV